MVSIRDVTPIPHNGCRPPKKRRGLSHGHATPVPVADLCRREAPSCFQGHKCLHREVPGRAPRLSARSAGQTGGRQRKASEYSKQMREKQKVNAMYGLSERQFRNTFEW